MSPWKTVAAFFSTAWDLAAVKGQALASHLVLLSLPAVAPGTAVTEAAVRMAHRAAIPMLRQTRIFRPAVAEGLALVHPQIILAGRAGAHCCLRFQGLSSSTAS